ncbi:hypothetical protein [Corallococcus llansteffanensis]|uniref:Uncharacterized protein n=1 Tax=Corallococcus llansteffanensis TaxID=2316731 RepID=A0A3A8Q720_9BACT|nr:hypothetical protein [Corallococcus llansteffanensis]RKH63918.1 hypothetical protein D7V93_08120 [Corallococcus llansteffanensis]
MTRGRWTINLDAWKVAAAVVVIGAGMAGAAIWASGRTRLTVVNETGRALKLLKLQIPGHECVFREVAAHAEVLCEGRADADGYLSASFEFVDGGGGRDDPRSHYVNSTFGLRGHARLNAEGTIEYKRED